MPGQGTGKKALRIPSEKFSQVLFSGVGTPLDAALKRGAGVRLVEERAMALDMMLEKTSATIFSFDIEEDTLYFLKVSVDGKREERKVLNFHAVLDMAVRGKEPEGRRFAEAFREAIRGPREDVVEFYGCIFTKEPHWNRVVYRSVPAPDGIVASIVGYSCVIDAERHGEIVHASSALEKLALERTPDRQALAERINARLRILQPGEKGTIFLINLTNYREISEHLTEEGNPGGFLHAVTDSILADFRGEDILGQISESLFVLFICGHTSLDIIERRAQRVIELVHRVSIQGFEDIRVSVGVAATGTQGVRYRTLYERADSALKTAESHGENNYRVYFEEEKI
jgi:diguanylate cyclase (GGDEF)-like protein